MEKTHQLPISIMIKARRLRWLEHAAHRPEIIWSNNYFLLRGCPGMRRLLDGLVALGCIMLRDVKDMGQQMGYRSLEWSWPTEAMKRPIWAGIVDEAKLF